MELSDILLEASKWAAVVGVVYPIITNVVISGVTSAMSKPLNTSDEVKKAVKKVSDHLNVDKSILITHNPNLPTCAYSRLSFLTLLGAYTSNSGGLYHLRKNSDPNGKPVVNFSSIKPSESDVRHEVYHVARGDALSRPESFITFALRYWFVQEPAAVLYDAFRIRL